MKPLAGRIIGAHPRIACDLPLRARTKQVAEIAASEARRVDRDGNFPHAAITAAKERKLLSLLVPRALGGEGASLAEVADVCFALSQACASTAMIFAMHQAALSCVIRHRQSSAWHEALLRRLVDEDLLFASSTTEGNKGGDVRSSAAPLMELNGRFSLSREATVISYGAEADAIVTTARRNEDAQASDQALAVLLRDNYSLIQTGTWDTLGMRGTRSAGFALRASASAEQVLPVPYKTIHVQSMVPISHMLWCGVWTGIAADALRRAQGFVRTSASQAQGRMPPGASNFAKALASFQGLRARLVTALFEFEKSCNEPTTLESHDVQAGFNLLKVAISDGALATVLMSMQTCGLAGYRSDGEFSVERQLRDVLSASIMINNDRIMSNIISAALVTPVGTDLGGL